MTTIGKYTITHQHADDNYCIFDISTGDMRVRFAPNVIDIGPLTRLFNIGGVFSGDYNSDYTVYYVADKETGLIISVNICNKDTIAYIRMSCEDGGKLLKYIINELKNLRDIEEDDTN